MSKQDRTHSRTPADAENKFLRNLGKTFAEIMGIATDARTKAEGTRSELSKAVASINKELADKGASIKLIVDSGVVDKDGNVQASIVISAINDQSEAKIKADNIVFEGQKLDIKVDATNIEGKLTAEQIDATNLKVKAANIEDKLTADQIDATDLKVKAANIDGTLTAKQIDATNLKVKAANIEDKLTAGQIDAKGLMVENEEGDFATYIKNGKISVVGTKLPDAAGSRFDIPILRFKAFDGLYYEMCVRMALEDPDPDLLGDEAVVPSSIVFRKDGYSLID